MWQAVSTELTGWRDAFSESEIRRTLLARILFALLLAGAGILGAKHPVPLLVGVALGVLAGNLILLRIRRRL